MNRRYQETVLGQPYREPSPAELERCYRAAQEIAAAMEWERFGVRPVPGSIGAAPNPGWNFGGGTSGRIE